MRDLIWIAALAAVLAGVWFFMARLDELLKGSAPQEPEAAGLPSVHRVGAGAAPGAGRGAAGRHLPALGAGTRRGAAVAGREIACGGAM